MTRIRAYIDLMKLRVVELLIITTVPAVVLAEGGFPSLALLAWTLIGGTLAAGSANAFNMVIESERDKLMKRTAKRPLVTGVVSRTEATIFACAIGLLSLAIFYTFTTPLATLLRRLQSCTTSSSTPLRLSRILRRTLSGVVQQVVCRS